NAPVAWVVCEFLFTLMILMIGLFKIMSQFENTDSRNLRFYVWGKTIFITAGVIVYFCPRFQNSFYWGSREPLSYFEQSVRQTLLARAQTTRLRAEEIAHIRARMELGAGWQHLNIDYPFCEERKLDKQPNPSAHRNVIMVIIEGLDARML